MKHGSQTVVVLGASDKPERYSNMAVRLLKQEGHRVIPVHPKLKTIEGLPVAPSLEAIGEKVHTLTIYIVPLRSQALAESILALRPDRVIFNPGTESPELEERFSKQGTAFVKACTLILLRTGKF
ncbi:MAG: CoA-binding protein [bacterium]